MKIIITESQKKSLDYSYLSNCIKRRIDLDDLDNIVNEAMDEFVSVYHSMELFHNMVINFAYDRLEERYGVEKCWEDQTWQEFSEQIERFLDSRYESRLKEFFKNHYGDEKPYEGPYDSPQY